MEAGVAHLGGEGFNVRDAGAHARGDVEPAEAVCDGRLAGGITAPEGGVARPDALGGLILDEGVDTPIDVVLLCGEEKFTLRLPWS